VSRGRRASDRPGRSPEADWFDRPGDPEPGLRFSCTQCGACCTGAEGYVMLSDDELSRLADRKGMSPDAFAAAYTRPFNGGRSLTEVETEHGFDCVFLDRETLPGRAICGVYEDRPRQCRTWPLWKQNLRRPRDWARAAEGCPGMNRGELIPPERIRIVRNSSPI